jgi:hypothetical protein
MTIQEAIERQIPKHIKRYFNGEVHCPTCEGNLTGMGFNYCVECGQKLDWEE